ncbi:MAG TPA: penicillin-binding transpeptidase domain-containing protein, partial [Candidatus Acidoferrales bacterium]|nr:penicillin-binding transpeptidase domain-containing protein [Candidatus Acidoferrales bacterium]
QHLFGNDAVEEGGLQVYTTVDPKMQKAAQDAVDWGVKSAEAEGINAHQAALVALRPSTGEILAMVGGTGFSLKNQFNRAWQAHRQPGSSFKLYVYTAAVDSGMPANTLIGDTPVSYPMGDGTMWSPQDDDFRYLGQITMREALALSRNVVAVKVADRIGLDKVIDYAHRMGIQSPLEANLSLALGSGVVTPLEHASGYATIADQGLHVDPTPFRIVKDSFGSTVLDDQYPQSIDVVSSGTAYIITTMLEDVINHGTGYPNAIIGRPAAGKTGTTSDFRDAWFVGFTPDLVAAVWLGNDDYSRMYESYGGNIPARVWARFMKAALAGTKPRDFVMPDDVVRVAGCGRGYEFYVKGTEPQGSCGSTSLTNYAADDQSPSMPGAAQPTLPPEETPAPTSSTADPNAAAVDSPQPSPAESPADATSSAEPVPPVATAAPSAPINPPR